MAKTYDKDELQAISRYWVWIPTDDHASRQTCLIDLGVSKADAITVIASNSEYGPFCVGDADNRDLGLNKGEIVFTSGYYRPEKSPDTSGYKYTTPVFAPEPGKKYKVGCSNATYLCVEFDASACGKTYALVNVETGASFFSTPYSRLWFANAGGWSEVWSEV